MNELLSLTLEAHDPEQNRHRLYSLTIGRDLFNDWTVTISHGRAGRRGRETRYASPDPSALTSVIRARLRRRLSAPKRIGCPYRLTEFRAARDFNAASWLPVDVMVGFLGEA